MKLLLVLLAFFATSSALQATSSDIYGTVDFLYWRPHVDGIEYVATGVNANLFGKGDIREVKWKWEPGFRLGLGKALPCVEGDLSLIFTWYKARAKDSSFSNPGNTIGVWNNAAFTSTDSASGNWHLNYYTLDLALDRELCFGRFLFAPAIALRAARTIERYNLVYVPESLSKNRQDLWALGPKAGFTSSWFLSPCFRLFGQAGLSLLCSNFKVRQKSIANDTIPASVSDLRHIFTTQLLVAEYSLGIEWERLLNQCTQLNFSAAWEQQIWFNHNQMIYGPYDNNNLILNRNTNLVLYGITLRAGIGF